MKSTLRVQNTPWTSWLKLMSFAQVVAKKSKNWFKPSAPIGPFVFIKGTFNSLFSIASSPLLNKKTIKGLLDLENSCLNNGSFSELKVMTPLFNLFMNCLECLKFSGIGNTKKFCNLNFFEYLTKSFNPKEFKLFSNNWFFGMTRISSDSFKTLEEESILALTLVSDKRTELSSCCNKNEGVRSSACKPSVFISLSGIGEENPRDIEESKHK
ncbi:hypothetical protein WICPIJ_003355 [Wickerhamomyces pijperi]|uniref:Uncharacterized protein n=1 Tax=Wickerhamomyces pijperi TaxID=599730 RepID=A0A9P8TPB0_WICPI|nr:hypothetical protein WICPIJ_003355 [Wickerhamomyces pijperi]